MVTLSPKVGLMSYEYTRGKIYDQIRVVFFSNSYIFSNEYEIAVKLLPINFVHYLHRFSFEITSDLQALFFARICEFRWFTYMSKNKQLIFHRHFTNSQCGNFFYSNAERNMCFFFNLRVIFCWEKIVSSFIVAHYYFKTDSFYICERFEW